MKRGQRIVERRRRTTKASKQAGRLRAASGGGGATKAPRQPLDLREPMLDYASLERKPYLTIPELLAYGSFETKNAAYKFLAKHRVAWAAGRVKRRDFDLAHERAAEERQRQQARRGRHTTQSPSSRGDVSSELSSPEVR